MPSLSKLEAVLARLAPAEVRIIEAFLDPRVRSARRRAARDAMIRALGVLHYPACRTGRELAKALYRDLAQYRTGCWRFERHREPAGDAKRIAFWQLLRLTDGQVLGPERLRDILAGLGKETAGDYPRDVPHARN
jgi:hypothetical protein